jgi:putative flavoprotein involved in K+ transport
VKATLPGTAAQRHEVVVVGGGQAGLAMGWHLARQGRHFTILDAASEPAAAWRQRWDSLTLFTPARYDGLPGLPFPGDPDHHPTRDEVVAYLTEYAGRFELPVTLDSRVTAIRAAGDDGHVVEVGDGRTYAAEQVVVATGPFQVPFTPPSAGGLDPAVVQLHSTGYRRPSDLPDGPALVVGGGNTGFQIAEELVASRQVHLSIGTRQTPLPQSLLGRDLFAFLTATGLIRASVETRLGRRLRGRETLIGSSPRRARRIGVRLHPRVTSTDGPTVSFEDGSRVAPASVVWATGFRPDHAFIQAPVFDEDGRVRHVRGVTGSPGLYVLGLPWQHTRGSALLGWVGDDAEFLAGRIAEHAATPRTARAGAVAAAARGPR